ncbi:DUF3382 domain-containing protein [Shigella flexneri]
MPTGIVGRRRYQVEPMHIAMALLSAAMFFILAGVFMGVQLELDGTELVVDTASDVRWRWVYRHGGGLFLPDFATCFPERVESDFPGRSLFCRD